MFYLACQDVLQVLPMPLTWNSWQQFVHIARETFAFRLQSGTFAAYAAAATRVHGPDWQAHTIANPNFAPFWHTLLHHFALADPPGTAQQRAVILSVLALLPPFSYNAWQGLFFQAIRRQPNSLPCLSASDLARIMWGFHGSTAVHRVDTLTPDQRSVALAAVWSAESHLPQPHSWRSLFASLTTPLTWNSWQQLTHLARETFDLPVPPGAYMSYTAAVATVYGLDWRARAIDVTDFAPLWQPLLRHLQLAAPPGRPAQQAACTALLSVLPPFSYNAWQQIFFQATRLRPDILPSLSSSQVSRMVWCYYGPAARERLAVLSSEQQALARATLLSLSLSPTSTPLVHPGRRLRRASLRMTLGRVAHSFRGVLQALPPLSSSLSRRLRRILRALGQINARLPAAHAVSPRSLANLRPGPVAPRRSRG